MESSTGAATEKDGIRATARKPATTPPASKRLRNVDTKMCAANDDIGVFSTSQGTSAEFTNSQHLTKCLRLEGAFAAAHKSAIAVCHECRLSWPVGNCMRDEEACRVWQSGACVRHLQSHADSMGIFRRSSEPAHAFTHTRLR